uniref:Uncharacterized protein n=1 Tax=Tanacetum cinerariifolium TaxID=118510 RepID=A0A6L2J5F4_TANCI|nr:hypothetical protein [Tanacetum cinerariifolium]
MPVVAMGYDQAEDEAKRKAGEEAAAKAKEEQKAIKKAAGEVAIKKVAEIKAKATKEQARKKANEDAKKKEAKEVAQAKANKQKDIKKASKGQNVAKNQRSKKKEADKVAESLLDLQKEAKRKKKEEQLEKERKIEAENKENKEKDKKQKEEEIQRCAREIIQKKADETKPKNTNKKKLEEKPAKMKKKTQASNSKEKKLRKNESEEEDYTDSEEEEEEKMFKRNRVFERYIHFLVVELPSTLAYNVIENFHTPSMEIRLQKGSIKATRQKVHDILSIPIGKTKLEDLEQRPYNDPFIAEWEAQYRHLGKPTPRAIGLQISSTHEADFMFNMNFITLFESTIGTLENGGRVSAKLLKCYKEDDDISDIDWCGYILDCLYTTAILGLNILLRSSNYLSQNSTQKLKHSDDEERIMMETRKRCLGDLEHRREFEYEEEDFYEKIIGQFTKKFKERYELIQTLRDGMNKFDGDQTMFDFCKEYKQVFKDVNFHLDDYFIDEYSDSNGDSDNKSNSNDEEGSPMKNENPIGNEQNENDNEKESYNKKEKETKDDLGKGKREGGCEPKEGREEVQADVNNEIEFEKVIGEDNEDAVLLDVDNQKEGEFEKVSGKVGNENEGNDNINKNEMKNDTLQKQHQVETDNEKQVEIDKQEKVDDTFDMLSRYGFKPIDKNKPCNGIYFEIRIHIKKQRRKSGKKSKKKPLRFLVSLYINKKTAIKAPIEPDEVMLSDSLFSMQGDPYEFSLKPKAKKVTIRDNMQTLAPQLKLEATVIDSFAAVLYHEEMVNNKGIEK